MNSLQRTFLSAIKTAMWDSPFELEDGVTEAALFGEARRYEVAGVLSTKLDVFCPSDSETRAAWSEKAFSDYSKSSFVLSAQSALCGVLATEGIKPVFLKGMSAAYYYPDPLLRQIGDIDFLVLPEQFDTCCGLLECNGYVSVAGGVRHLAYEKQGIKYECHRYFSLNKTEADKRIDSLLYEGCRNCIVRSLVGREYYVLPDIENGIVLLEHLKHHLIDGVGFRQVMDWCLYVDKVLDDRTWEDSFCEKVQACGLEVLAKSVTRMAQMHMGLRTDGISWCDDVDEAVCDALVEMIFTCNNFGFVSEGEGGMRAIGYVARRGLFSNFNARALSHMPIAEKVVVLRPFAWLCQIIRWGVMGTSCLIHRGNGSAIAVQAWRSQSELLRQIGVEG